ncbi:unnamed protein product [Heligmosomoides polygyrus]|uniref:Uncharacterized protein n=1 Tax=Heligmosomoides polygyrus TaxID=6339 RepID=A0A183FTP2_HELPZ|nr:unnamed protein product [Heligmosomoides polygyrus]
MSVEHGEKSNDSMVRPLFLEVVRTSLSVWIQGLVVTANLRTLLVLGEGALDSQQPENTLCSVTAGPNRGAYFDPLFCADHAYVFESDPVRNGYCTVLHRRDGVSDLGRENRVSDVSILWKMAWGQVDVVIEEIGVKVVDNLLHCSSGGSEGSVRTSESDHFCLEAGEVPPGMRMLNHVSAASAYTSALLSLRSSLSPIWTASQAVSQLPDAHAAPFHAALGSLSTIVEIVKMEAVVFHIVVTHDGMFPKAGKRHKLDTSFRSKNSIERCHSRPISEKWILRRFPIEDVGAQAEPARTMTS